MEGEGFESQFANKQLSQYSIIESRINPNAELKQIEEYLTGTRQETYIKEDGNYGTRVVKLSEPVMNSEGIGSFMQALNLRINKMVVMGNFSRDQYMDFISDTRKEITMMMVLKRPRWQIHPSNLRPMIDNVLGFVEPFLSRLIDNKEREGLNKQFTSSEKHVISGKTDEE